MSCTDHIGGNLDFEEANLECLKRVDCIGFSRQNVNPSSICGNDVTKLCRSTALRGFCDCTNSNCDPSECSRYKQDKLTCIDFKIPTLVK